LARLCYTPAMPSQLKRLLTQTRRPRILVVGDVMLDRYLWGDVDRISPEAPIPVLKVRQKENRLGGAGSVASMLAALDADVTLITVTGNDAEGNLVRELLENVGVDTRSVLANPAQMTIVKERLLGRTHSRNPQQIMRVDHEQDEPIGCELAEQLLDSVAKLLVGSDLLLISDYGKGVCEGDMIPRIIELANSVEVPVVADPISNADYSRYAGCECITPNRNEAAAALGMSIVTTDDGLEAAERLLDFGVRSAIVTLDRHGIAWAGPQGQRKLFPVQARQVYDITGAGDMVLSALGYCLASGVDYPKAIELANIAGGLEVQKLGVVPLSRRELLGELLGEGYPAEQKLHTVDQLMEQLRKRRQPGVKVVLTNGCFDILHPGHVALLQEARRQGDLLVVGLNSDASARKLKGPGHPVIDQEGRAEMLSAMGCVDYVVLFDDQSVLGLVERVLPDVLVKADQYSASEVVGHEAVERNGGQVVRVPMKGIFSSSSLVEKIHQSAAERC
jgi:D-beta-D-heptose 7-phosphate kinase/D-beta-D-heptose 1-phosphate adenosyltransferase